MGFTSALGGIVSGIAGVADIFGGGDDKKRMETSTTTLNMPAYVQDEAEALWNDWYGRFVGDASFEYPLLKKLTGAMGFTPDPGIGIGKGYETMLKEDTAHVKRADRGYTNALKAMLDDMVGQATEGTGYYKPVSFGFGGNQMASIVPKQNIDFANMLMALGDTRASADLRYRTKHTPNEADRAFTDYMKDLAFALNVDKSPTTTTKTVEEVPDSNKYGGLGGQVTSVLGGIESLIK